VSRDNETTRLNWPGLTGCAASQKLRRDAFTFTNTWPPQKDGAVSFKRMLGGNTRSVKPTRPCTFAI
jgi:hypothetical protein